MDQEKHNEALTGSDYSQLYEYFIETPLERYQNEQYNDMFNYSLLRQQINTILAVPARLQLISSQKPAAYNEGDQEYNIWYHKHLTDRYDHTRPLRELASYKCDPSIDSGYTKADLIDDHKNQFFCIYYARGCCTSGSNCTFRHRIPTELDELWIDTGKDVFGRERHGSHRDDMSGVGSFNDDCTTIFVGGLQNNRGLPNGAELLEKTLWEEFGKWGKIVSLRVIHPKCIAFIKYACRLQAEFAKVAMSDQPLGIHSQILSVRWAYTLNKSDDKKPDKPKVDPSTQAAINHMHNLQGTIYNTSLSIYQQLISNLTPEEAENENLLQQLWNSAYTQSWTIYSSSTQTLQPNSLDDLYPSSNSNQAIDLDYQFASYDNNHNEEEIQNKKKSIGPVTKEDYINEENEAKTQEELNRMQSILEKIDNLDEKNFSIKI